MSDQHNAAPVSTAAARAAALEALLVEKELITTDAIDAVVDTFEHDVGPHNGARIVARAWSDAAYADRLAADATAAAAELDIGGVEAEHLVAVFNTPEVHNVIVCTLCSCYPWPVLGIPPVWYKSPPYRARVVSEPRIVLAEMGLTMSDDVEVRVWDSSADVRYIVVPERPAGTEGWDEGKLAALVTRDTMIGTARCAPPS